MAAHGVVQRQLFELPFALFAVVGAVEGIDGVALAVSLLHPDQALLLFEITQLAVEQPVQQLGGLGMAGGGQGGHALDLGVEVPVQQLREGRVQGRVAGFDVRCRGRGAQA